MNCGWWAVSDLNAGPSRCKRDALTAELTAQLRTNLIGCKSKRQRKQSSAGVPAGILRRQFRSRQQSRPDRKIQPVPYIYPCAPPTIPPTAKCRVVRRGQGSQRHHSRPKLCSKPVNTTRRARVSAFVGLIQRNCSQTWEAELTFAHDSWDHRL